MLEFASSSTAKVLQKSSYKVPKPGDDTKGRLETEYRVPPDRCIWHIVQWTGRPDNPEFYMLKEIGAPDFVRPLAEVPEPVSERPLGLDEVLALSLPAVWMD